MENNSVMGAQNIIVNGMNLGAVQLNGKSISEDLKILEKLDFEVIKLLALKQLQQMIGTPQEETDEDSEPVDTLTDVVSKLKSFSMEFDEKLLNTNNPILSRNFKETCPGVYEVLDDNSSESGHSTSDSEATLSPTKTVDIPDTDDCETIECSKSTKALLIPVSSFEDDFEEFDSVPIFKNNFSIGADSSSDFCLKSMSQCSFISDLHAVISYDEITKKFTLVNFSEFGSIVDHISYGLTNVKRNHPMQSKLSSDISEIGEIQKKRKRILDNSAESSSFLSNSERDRLDSMNMFTSSCKCVDPPKRADCEDTAVLTNGSIVKIGCKQFNFTYTMDPL